MKNNYKKIKNAYFESHQGVISGGLGETTLSQPKCFCTDLKNVDLSSIIEIIDINHNKIKGWCQYISKCNKCNYKYSNKCITKIIS